jgi:cellulose synthase/poly-beta-1,6-N-acetylglucosamine synthase-like glycosyltransferase
MESKFVSIIIPTYREWHLLIHCINALTKQTYPKEKFEVIIINNDASQTAPSDLFLPENFKLIIEEKKGSYAARNAGLQIAKGEIIGFTDSDCIPDKDWIKNAVDYFKNNEACTRIAGYIPVFTSSNPTKAELFDKFYLFPQHSFVAELGACVTANMFTYRYVFDKVGLFNDTLMSGGDILWGKLAQQANFNIHYVENVVVKHPATKTIPQLIKRAKRYAGGTVQTYSKDKSRVENFINFLYSLRHRFKSRIKTVYIESEAFNAMEKELTPIQKINIKILKYYLLYIRIIEVLRVQMGKEPNRA